MINTVTLNPAMDEILYIESFQQNCMNRIQKKEKCLGGKGTHLAYNFSLLNVPNRTFGVSFGRCGQEVIDVLKESGADTHYLWYETPETRTNYLVVDEERNCTFLGGKGEVLTREITENLLRLMETQMQKGDTLIIAGDASNVDDKDIQKKLLEIAKKMDLKLYLDSSGAFMKEGLKYHPQLIKPNLEELSEIVGRELKNADDVVEALDELPDIPVVMVSMGGDGWVFRYEGKIYRGYGLKVQVGNTAGCGDALLTGLIYGLECNPMPVMDMLAYATALSATCAASNKTVGFDIKTAKEWMKDVKIEVIR